MIHLFIRILHNVCLAIYPILIIYPSIYLSIYLYIYLSINVVFANTCRQSTDFHFNSIDDQLSLVQQYTAALNEKRVINSISVTPSPGSQDLTQGNSPTRTPDRHSPDSSVERYKMHYTDSI